MNTIAWLIISVVMFIGEMVCPVFFMFWFAIGALAALVVSLITSNLAVQIVVFLVVSIVLVIFMKPLTNKLFKNKTKDELNMNGIIGKTAVVTKKIDNLNGTGEVKIHGEVWRALNESDNEIIEAEKHVEVLRIDGVKLIVKAITEINENTNEKEMVNR